MAASAHEQVDGKQDNGEQQRRDRMVSLDLTENLNGGLGEEDEGASFEERQLSNPCVVLQSLTRDNVGAVEGLMSRVGSSWFGRLITRRDASEIHSTYESNARVVRVGVKVPKRGLSLASSGRSEVSLKTMVRYPEECTLELTIGGSLTRTREDFEWVRSRLRDEYAGCVVPPLLTAGDDDPDKQAMLYEQFLTQCLEHPELGESESLRLFCVLADSELRRTRSNQTHSRRTPTHVRVGALILDVVGDATPVFEDDASGKRREADVRELYTWAREQVAQMSKCEAECAKGVEALKQFEAADKNIRTRLAAKYASTPDEDDDTGLGASAPASGPTRAHAALRELVGLAKALCEAIESRERVRLQLVAARNALELNKASESARRTMLDAAAAQAKAADDLQTRAAALNASSQHHDDREILGHALPAESDLDAPIIEKKEQDHLYETKQEGAPNGAAANTPAPFDENSQATAELSHAQLALEAWSKRAADAYAVANRRIIANLGDRQVALQVARSKAISLGSLGLRVVSRAALGAAAISSNEDDVKRAEELVDKLKLEFKVADDRLSADAPILKLKWDHLQLQAFESFAVGEQTRADLARANADAAALKLAAAKAAATSA